jgi:glycerophosphoryl diester phosphodiesterase
MQQQILSLYMVYRVLFLFALTTIAAGASAQYIPKFDVQGHRGARGLKPENTIPAFLLAIDSGVTTIEMDVVITKDKQVVVSHEPWISPAICLDPSGDPLQTKDEKKFNIYQLTYDEVKQFDCGSLGNKNFPLQEKTAISKPLLSDVIGAVENHIKSYASYEVDYNIEIKSSPEGDKKFHPSVEEFSDLVYALVDQYLPLERIVIQSFDFRVLKYWNKKYPHIRLAALIENNKSIDSNLAALGFKPSIYSPYFKLLSKEKVSHLHREKIRVIPWTVNEVSEMLSLKGMGVDGFITDYPDRARKYKMTLNIQRP